MRVANAKMNKDAAGRSADVHPFKLFDQSAACQPPSHPSALPAGWPTDKEQFE